MLANHEMRRDRYRLRAEAKKLHARIVGHIKAGGLVRLRTYTRARIFLRAEDFRCGDGAVFVRRGRSWDCIIPQTTLIEYSATPKP